MFLFFRNKDSFFLWRYDHFHFEDHGCGQEHVGNHMPLVWCIVESVTSIMISSEMQ